MTYKQQIDTLYDLMQNAGDLMDVVKYFQNHLGKSTSLVEDGELVNEHSSIKSFLQMMLHNESKKDDPILLFLSRNPYKNFIHGNAYIGSLLLTILFSKITT